MSLVLYPSPPQLCTWTRCVELGNIGSGWGCAGRGFERGAAQRISEGGNRANAKNNERRVDTARLGLRQLVNAKRRYTGSAVATDPNEREILIESGRSDDGIDDGCRSAIRCFFRWLLEKRSLLGGIWPGRECPEQRRNAGIESISGRMRFRRAKSSDFPQKDDDGDADGEGSRCRNLGASSSWRSCGVEAVIHQKWCTVIRETGLGDSQEPPVAWCG